MKTSIASPLLGFLIYLLSLCVIFGCDNTEEREVPKSLNPIAVPNLTARQ